MAKSPLTRCDQPDKWPNHGLHGLQNQAYFLIKILIIRLLIKNRVNHNLLLLFAKKISIFVR